MLRRNRKDLHEALEDIVPTLIEFVNGELSGEELWYPYSEFFREHDSEWAPEAWRRLEGFLAVIDDCVPDGTTPNPDFCEVTETELRKLVSELLVEAGYEPRQATPH